MSIALYENEELFKLLHLRVCIKEALGKAGLNYSSKMFLSCYLSMINNRIVAGDWRYGEERC